MTEKERQELLDLLLSGKMTEEEEIELLEILEQERKEEAFSSYEVYSEEYIKIVDKHGNRVPFVHNSMQKKINDKVLEIKASGQPVRIIILKARQGGASTNEQGRLLYNTTTKGNRTGLIVAHNRPATSKIFEKAKYMYDNLPEDIKPLNKASNASELIFDTPTGYKGKEKGLNSKISIQTAGDVGIGRGDTIYYAHLSEFAYWEGAEGKEPLKQLSGILQAVPKVTDTEVIIESTANGFNDFMELWDDAVAGRNGWVPMFFPWQDIPEYRMECTEEQYIRALNSVNKKTKDYLCGVNEKGKNIKGIIELFNLSKEQVRWWIWTFKNDCNSDMNMMKQENPTMANEAFLSTGTPVFDNEIVKSRIEYLTQEYKKNPFKKGRFYFEWNNPDAMDFIKNDTIRWVDDPNGFVNIYEDVSPGYPYVMGGDTKGEGRDFYTGNVINNVTGNRVATIRHCWSNSKPYTWQIYCLGMYYNTALIAIETNWNTAPIEELQRLHYPRQYTRRRYDDFTKEYKKAYGWRTDGNTRPLIIDKTVHLIEQNIELFNDIQTLQECLTFIYDKRGRPDAMSGKHDDALFADMIGNEVRNQQSFEADLDIDPVYGSFDEDTEYTSIGYSESPFE